MFNRLKRLLGSEAEKLIHNAENGKCGTINLADYKLSYEQNRRLAKAFAKSDCAYGLIISCNNFYASEIAQIIRSNKSLNFLYLVGEDFKTAEWIEIAESLEINSSLLGFGIIKSAIHEEEEMKAFGKALQNNTTLIHLDLSANRNCGGFYFGIIHIVKALEINKTLLSLDLSCNQLMTFAPTVLEKLLSTSTTLLCLDLYLNGITDECAEKLLNEVNQNESLLHLRLGYSTRDVEKGCEANIENILTRNRSKKNQSSIVNILKSIDRASYSSFYEPTDLSNLIQDIESGKRITCQQESKSSELDSTIPLSTATKNSSEEKLHDKLLHIADHDSGATAYLDLAAKKSHALANQIQKNNSIKARKLLEVEAKTEALMKSVLMFGSNSVSQAPSISNSHPFFSQSSVAENGKNDPESKDFLATFEMSKGELKNRK